MSPLLIDRLCFLKLADDFFRYWYFDALSRHEIAEHGEVGIRQQVIIFLTTTYIGFEQILRISVFSFQHIVDSGWQFLVCIDFDALRSTSTSDLSFGPTTGAP